MEKPEISIILPGIRPYNWSKLYDSIVKSTTRRFELIVVGPYRPPDMLQNDIHNFKYVKDLCFINNIKNEITEKVFQITTKCKLE